MKKLRVFVSSVGALRRERDCVERTLDELEIEAVRFESWTASPRDSRSECRQKIDESDAVVLLLGAEYGDPGDDGLSPTHDEYRHALTERKPVFAYVLAVESREDVQEDFVNEVEADRNRGRRVRDQEELELAVRMSFLEEFARCFRQEWTPPGRAPTGSAPRRGLSSPPPSWERDTVHAHLKGLLDSRNDEAVHELAEQVESRFASDGQILQLVYLAEINLGLNHGAPNPGRLSRGLDWLLRARDRLPKYRSGFSYNIANALYAMGRFDDAVAAYRDLLSERPPDELASQAWKNLGTAYAETRAPWLAIACYERALEIDPDLFEALYCLGVALLKHRREPERALEAFQRIDGTGLPPSIVASIHGWIAIASQALGRPRESIDAGETALQLAPETAWTWRTLGSLYATLRHTDDWVLAAAPEYWSRYTTAWPEEPVGHLEHARALMALADRTESPVGKVALVVSAVGAFDRSAQAAGATLPQSVWQAYLEATALIERTPRAGVQAIPDEEWPPNLAGFGGTD